MTRLWPFADSCALAARDALPRRSAAPTSLGPLTLACLWLSAAVVRAHDPSLDAPLPTLPEYLRLGVEHVLTGYDHLAFVLGLALLAQTRRATLLSVTSFTCAHSLSLGACVLDLVAPSARWIEVGIALSIAYVAIARWARLPSGGGVGVALVFGFVHGFGFAGALEEVGVPSDAVVPALALFNAGVELGQLAVLMVLLPLLERLRARPALWATLARGLHAALFLLGIGLAIERSQWLWFH